MEVKSFHSNNQLHKILASVRCVRWNSSGDKIASASADSTVVVTDLKAGKYLYATKGSILSKFLHARNNELNNYAQF